jgi:hypothetical protein
MLAGADSAGGADVRSTTAASCRIRGCDVTAPLSPSRRGAPSGAESPPTRARLPRDRAAGSAAELADAAIADVGGQR